jgi:L-threonylcarbamoyladenylate synthase
MIGQNIAQAAELLKRGEVIAVPTETVYGLAGNALDERVVAHIFAIKKRPSFDPLIVHVARWQGLQTWVQNIPPLAQRLAEAFMPGALTLLLEKKPNIPDLVTAGSPLVAVRIPAHPMAQALLQALPFPLAAPSANPFGYISPTRAEHVAHQLGDQIPYILDGGPCHIGLESTIIGFPEGQPTVYRKGGLAVEAIEALIGSVQVIAHSSSNPQAPGMLKSHYAPRVPLILGTLSELLPQYRGKAVGVLSFKESYAEIPSERQFALSSSGDYTEAARNLFSAMRQLDHLPIDFILTELLPEEGLGRAINDRLRRAAAKT